jgi:hypothetical protein
VYRSTLVKATLFEGRAKGILDAADGHGLGGLRQLDVVTAFGGKEQHRMAMRAPIVAQALQRLFRFQSPRSAPSKAAQPCLP